MAPSSSTRPSRPSSRTRCTEPALLFAVSRDLEVQRRGPASCPTASTSRSRRFKRVQTRDGEDVVAVVRRCDTAARAAAGRAPRWGCSPKRCSRAWMVFDWATSRVTLRVSSRRSRAWNSRRRTRLLEPALAPQAADEALPQVVVLAHAVVEPADVPRMAHRVRREAEGDHLVDGLAVRGLAHVGQPGREVGRELAAEAVLRRDQHLGQMSGAAQGGRRLLRDDQVPAADEQGAGGDDQDTLGLAHAVVKPSPRGPHHAGGHAHRHRAVGEVRGDHGACARPPRPGRWSRRPSPWPRRPARRSRLA